jgi:hypothetical protein
MYCTVHTDCVNFLFLFQFLNRIIFYFFMYFFNFFVFQGTLSETREYEIFFFHLVEVLVNDAGYIPKILRFRTQQTQINK